MIWDINFVSIAPVAVKLTRVTSITGWRILGDRYYLIRSCHTCRLYICRSQRSPQAIRQHNQFDTFCIFPQISGEECRR